mmetsp:Transcript_9373/g.13473  ORF Transcript_9373/g.13473 Transcript_9373/m.13473 type:complete len:82 (+) Transcript_9373:468-713(+)
MDEENEVTLFLEEMGAYLSDKLTHYIAKTYKFTSGHCLHKLKKRDYQLKVKLKESSWSEKYKKFSKLFCKAKKFNAKKKSG